jgi:hypothetical protein
MKPRKRHKIMSLNFHRKSPAAFYFLLLTSALLTACASSQPRPVASYSSTLRSSENEPRQLATMSDEEVGDQRAGTTKKETTAESQTTSKRGKTQKQESEVTELVETDISTVIETTSSPTADQDVQ